VTPNTEAVCAATHFVIGRISFCFLLSTNSAIETPAIPAGQDEPAFLPLPVPPPPPRTRYGRLLPWLRANRFVSSRPREKNCVREYVPPAATGQNLVRVRTWRHFHECQWHGSIWLRRSQVLSRRVPACTS